MASEPTRSASTRASCTRRGGKRRRPPDEDAESSLPRVAAKRHHRAEDGENQGVEPDDCVLGEARAGLERRLHQFVACMCLPRALLEHGEELIPASAPFYRQVRDISHSMSKELRWTPEALLGLKNEAECYLAQVFGVVDQLARAVMAQPIPWYHKNTRLTLEQEEAVFALSCGTSGIPVYVLKIMEWHVSKQLVLSTEYCRCFLAPRLGSETGQIKIFCGNNPTGSEVCFSAKNNFRLFKGWRNYVKTNCIKEGDKYALTFEEDEEGGLLSTRMHLLNGVPGSEEYDQERPLSTLSPEHSAAVTRAASMHIPYWHFVRLVQEITKRFSCGYCWERNALISLHQINGDGFPVTVTIELENGSCNQEICVNFLWRLLRGAVEYLVSLFEVVNQSVIPVLAPYIRDDTNLTPEEEEAAIILSFGCASGTRAYIWTMKRGQGKYLYFEKKFTEQYLSRYLASGGWKIKLFAGDNLTPIEVENKLTKHKTRGDAIIYGGWSRIVRNNGIKAGDVCAVTFEEEGDSLSVRVHVLRQAPMRDKNGGEQGTTTQKLRHQNKLPRRS